MLSREIGYVARVFNRSRFTQGSLLIAAYSALFTLTYFGILSGDYLHADDYQWLPPGMGHGRVEMIRTVIAAGRPIYAGTILVTALIGDHLGIVCARLILVLLLSTFSALLCNWMKRLLPSYTAFALSFAVGTLPVFLSGLGFISAGLHIVALILGLMGGIQVWKALEAKQAGLRGASGALLYLAALATYQVAAQIFWVIPFSLLLFRRNNERGRTFAFVSIGAMVQLTYFIVLKVCLYLFGSPLADRMALNLQPLVKAKWFLEEPLQNAMNLWNVPPDSTIGWAMCAWVALGLMLPFQLKRVLGLAFLFLIAYTPNLAIAENWASYRTLFVISPFALFLVLNTGYRLTEGLGDWQERSGFGFTCTAALIGVVSTAHYSHRYLVAQRRAEVGFMTARLNETGKVKTLGRILIVQNDLSETFGLIYDEFNVPSSSMPFALGGLTKFALTKLNRDPEGIQLERRETLPLASELDEHTVVVDMRAFAWPPEKGDRKDADYPM